ncbi:MAG: hypothetical protein ACK4SY_06900 [Pyrobaculum sp.]
MEAVEVAVVAGILLAFVAFAFLLLPAHAPPYDVTQQPQLTNLAQQALDRMIIAEGDIAARRQGGQPAWRIVDLTLSAPRPLYQPQIDDRKLVMLTYGTAASGTCEIRQQAFVEETGVDRAYVAGFGVLTPAGSVEVDYAALLKNFFGEKWDLYDMSVRIKPLANLTICPNIQGFTRGDPMCVDVPQGVWIRSTAGGRVVATVLYCYDDVCDVYSKTYSLTPSGQFYQANMLDDRLNRLIQDTAGGRSHLAIYVQRLDYPRGFDLYAFNTADRPLAYGMFLSFRNQLWLLHDSLCRADSNPPALGVRKLQIYTGGGFINLGSDITLDPGQGAGVVKVDHCSGCTSNARCAACWVEVPPNALFAVVQVERVGRPESALAVVPLMPVARGSIQLDTWRRWTPLEPKLQTAKATRVVDSQSATYLVEVLVYRRP